MRRSGDLPQSRRRLLDGEGPRLRRRRQGNGVAFTFLSADRLATQNTNEVLVLALTPAGSNVILTARVLDKSNGGAVLYERSIVDTPASDPSLDSAQIAAITGGTVQVQDHPVAHPGPAVNYCGWGCFKTPTARCRPPRPRSTTLSCGRMKFHRSPSLAPSSSPGPLRRG